MPALLLLLIHVIDARKARLEAEAATLDRQRATPSPPRAAASSTDALVAALAGGGLAGTGLDVCEGKPAPPTAWLSCTNVVLTPP